MTLTVPESLLTTGRAISFWFTVPALAVFTRATRALPMKTSTTPQVRQVVTSRYSCLTEVTLGRLRDWPDAVASWSCDCPRSRTCTS